MDTRRLLPRTPGLPGEWWSVPVRWTWSTAGTWRLWTGWGGDRSHMARRPLHGAPKPEGTYSHRHDGSASKRNQEGAGAPERRGEGGRNMREGLPEGRPGRRLRDEAPQPRRCSALRSHLWLYSILGPRGGGALLSARCRGFRKPARSGRQGHAGGASLTPSAARSAWPLAPSS